MRNFINSIGRNKKNHNSEYMLCFHDFSEGKRHSDIFIRLRDSCGDTLEDIFKKFNRDGNATRFIRRLLHMNDGYWRLIHIENIKHIQTGNYDEIDEYQ